MRYLPAGFGYYDTTNYPIGGSFKRAVCDIGILEIIREFQKFQGCNAEVLLSTGKTAGLNLEYVKTNGENENGR